MKKVVASIIGVAALGAISPALAADLPLKAPYTKAPVMVAPVADWTGWYIGGNVGWGGNSSISGTESVVSGTAFPVIGAGTVLYGSPNSFKLDPSGVIGGAQAGYNWQVSPMAVLGIEADIQGADVKGSLNCVLSCGAPHITAPTPGFLAGFPVVFSNDAYSSKINWFGTVRGRVGYTNGPALFYLTGGLAYGEVERAGSVTGITQNGAGGSTRNTFTGAYDNKSTRTGWTVGLGGEAKIASTAWTIKGEYLYVDLGKNSDSFSTNFISGNPATGQAAFRTDTSTNRENIVRVGVNYHFYNTNAHY
jgi:outer membrane immunogenic protein